MHIESQNKMLFDYLMTGCPVTGLEALKMFGISCLPRRVMDVEEDFKVRIDRERIPVKTKFGKKYVMKYFIKNKIK